MEIQKAESDLHLLTSFVPSLEGKVVVDVGCGTGKLVRELTKLNARVTGIEKPELLLEAEKSPRVGDERYLPAQDEILPFADAQVDLVIYFASLHHIPAEKMRNALKEAQRVLKNGGLAVFVEPAGGKGTYSELAHLVDNERRIRTLAYREIKKAKTLGFVEKAESMFYFERSYQHFVACLDLYVKDEQKRNDCLEKARKKITRLSRQAGVSFDDFRCKSICRVNVLEKR